MPGRRSSSTTCAGGPCMLPPLKSRSASKGRSGKGASGEIWRGHKPMHIPSWSQLPLGPGWVEGLSEEGRAWWGAAFNQTLEALVEIQDIQPAWQ